MWFKAQEEVTALWGRPINSKKALSKFFFIGRYSRKKAGVGLFAVALFEALQQCFNP